MGRMHMDPGHSWRYNSRRPGFELLLNLGIMVLCVLGYFANQHLLKSITSNFIVVGHLNDVLAMIILLSYSNILILCGGKKSFVLCTHLRAISFVLAVGFFWEYVTPMYKSSTSDPYDLSAYLLGGETYLLLIRARYSVLCPIFLNRPILCNESVVEKLN